VSDLWTAAEIAAATGGRSTGGWRATGVSIDSRTVGPGDLFVALSGPNFDGHDFVADALKRGAAAALIARIPAGLPEGAPVALVDDTMRGLEALGRAARARTRAKVLGVTGSVGKTGTKEMLRVAFAGQGETYASVGSFNNHWGVPLSLARMPRDTGFGIFEMGMNHPGELRHLTRIARPEIALVTTVEPAHLGHFESVEAIADAKAEIFEGVPQGGAAVLNRDNPFHDRLERAVRAAGVERIISFGEGKEATVRLLTATLGATFSRIVAGVCGERIEYSLAVAGRHLVMNSLAVLAAVKAAGADVGGAAAALGRVEGLAGRGRRHRIALPGGGSFELIDESYNASPASMRAAFAVLAAAEPAPGGRRIAVLGDMLELGSESERLHAELAEPLGKANVNHVFTVGRDMKRLHDALPPGLRGGHAANSVEMAEIMATVVRPGDVVTVKGSLGSRMAEVVKRLLAGGDATMKSAVPADHG
jgi:UDP-N-acetylmuramoyl-tripeptide--D-alanyl-D-alanine ligase